MNRYIPYQYKKSSYELWSERDIEKAMRDQKWGAVMIFGMVVGIVEVFLFAFLGQNLVHLISLIVTIALTTLGIIPLWRYSKKWVMGMKGSFHLRAISDDEGYQFLKFKITEILDEAGFDYRIEDAGFQAEIGTEWYPEKEVMTLTGPLKVVELTYDITRVEGLTLKLNSLAMYPGLEDRLISGLDNCFSLKPDGRLVVRS
jgi:hypothetical protein